MFSLALLLVESPYFAYMTLLFLAVYYLIRYFRINSNKKIKKFLLSGSTTIGLCLLGIGISAVLFVPMCIQMLSSPRISGGISLSLALGTARQYLTILGRILSNNIFGTSYYAGEWNFYEAPFLLQYIYG